MAGNGYEAVGSDDYQREKMAHCDTHDRDYDMDVGCIFCCEEKLKHDQ